MKSGIVAALFLCLSAGAWANDSLVSIGDKEYLRAKPAGGKITYLRYPTLGCPAIVKEGAGGTAWIKLADGGVTTAFGVSITPTVEPQGTSYNLPVTGATFDSAYSLYKVSYTVPAGIPEDTYDFHVSIPSSAVKDVQYNAFKVVQQETKNFTFIHISDTHFNTPTGWKSPANYNTGKYDPDAIIQQMKKEIRALNPTFVVLSGDLMFGIDYNYEYEAVWNIWKDAGFPIFMAPGNHDGIAGVEERTFMGIVSPKRDGLDYWRKYFGPNYYSFEFGGVHFQAVNSLDGTPERRDGFLIIIENFGGDLLPEQMDWISADLAAAKGTVVPFLHHNPMGPYSDNQPFGMWSWVLTRIMNWALTGELTYISQTWNTKATADFLLSKWAGAPIVFCGHHHKDIVKTYQNTTYREVTTAGADGQYWGYAPVRVENSKVVEHLYSNDPKFMSVPTGNLHIKPVVATGAQQKVEVQSGLSKAYEVTIQFLMPSATEYSATGGKIVQIAPANSKITKVWVRTPAPTAKDIQSPKSTEVSVTAAGVLASVEEASEASGGGCGAPNLPGHAKGHLLLTLLPLAILLGLRRRR